MIRMLPYLSAALMLLAGSPSAQPQSPVAAPANAAAMPASDADPALWVVKDADTTIYLFGTVHVLKPGLSWFDEAVKTAFDKSDQLVLEIPLPDPAEAQRLIAPLGIDPTGPTLPEKLPPAKRAAFAAALAKLGVPEHGFDRLQPWFAAVSISQIQLQKAGYGADAGAERTLDAAARAAGKPVSGLETLAQQLGYFHDLPQSAQIEFLTQSIDDLAGFDRTIDVMVKKWSAGDPEALGRLLNKDVGRLPLLYKVLLKDRNSRWAAWIDKRMQQPGTVFIAVGAGHLAGKDSVQAQLQRYHLKAARIIY